MEIDGRNFQATVLGFGLLFAIFVCVAMSHSEEKIAPEPVHTVGSQHIPVVAVEDDAKFTAEDFRLIQLDDGHDYWVFRNRKNDRGYAGMAHSPECQKCVKGGDRLVDRL
jgi:hypothetical protein